MDVERTLQELVDRQQILDTLYRYASTIDSKDYPRLLRALFADDAVAQYAGGEPLHGADTIVSWIDQMTLDRSWQHHLLSVYHVDIEGDEARTLTYHTSHQLTDSDPDTVIEIVGTYRDTLRKLDGAWKIVDKVFEVVAVGRATATR